jgi:rubrerythrin
MEDSKINENTALRSFIENEILLHRLYAHYAGLFPDDKEFWQDISADEAEHAGWVSSLSNRIDNGEVRLTAGRFEPEALTSFADYIQEQIDRIDTENILQIQALSISMDLENSMLEKGLFKSYETDSTELREVMNRLEKSTETHYSEVKNRWMAERELNH